MSRTDGTYTSAVQPLSTGGFWRPQNINRMLLVLGFIGIFDASLLSEEVLFRLNLSCGAEGGCATVASHPSAYWFGIPVAFFGFAAYLTLTVLAAIRGIAGIEKTKPLTYVGYAMAGVGALTSIFLQYEAFYVIGAFCPYCFGSAVNMILTLVLYALMASKLNSLTAPEGVAKNSGGDASWVAIGSLFAVVAVVIGGAVLKSDKKQPVVAPITFNQERLKATPGDEHGYGDPKSKIVITEFADLACIHCQALTPKLHEFVDKHPGQVYTIWRHFPLEHAHPMAITAALISEYAARKGKFWDYADRIFATGEEPKTPDQLLDPAKAIGLNVADIKTELNKSNSPELDVLTKDMSDASFYGLSTTPTFFIVTPGQKVRIATASDVFDVLTSSPYKEMLK